MSDFSQNLKYLRSKEALSQRGLAERINVSLGALQAWEKDTSIPNANAVIDIAEYFGITTDELLGVDKINPGQSIATGFGLDANEQHLLDVFRQLEEDQQYNIIATIELFARTTAKESEQVSSNKKKA